jgi:hypothetical protein
MLNILALDLGTTVGWAMSDSNGKIVGGATSIAGKFGEPAIRWLNFRQFLSDRRNSISDIHACYYERMTYAPNQHNTASVYGALEALLHIWCHTNKIRFQCVSPKSIKKYWVGNGNAKKEDMLCVARERGFTPIDHNHADAIALLSYAHGREK